MLTKSYYSIICHVCAIFIISWMLPTNTWASSGNDQIMLHVCLMNAPEKSSNKDRPNGHKFSLIKTSQYSMFEITKIDGESNLDIFLYQDDKQSKKDDLSKCYKLSPGEHALELRWSYGAIPQHKEKPKYVTMEFEPGFDYMIFLLMATNKIWTPRIWPTNELIFKNFGDRVQGLMLLNIFESKEKDLKRMGLNAIILRKAAPSNKKVLEKAIDTFAVSEDPDGLEMEKQDRVKKAKKVRDAVQAKRLEKSLYE